MRSSKNIKELVLATTNAGKLRELQQLFAPYDVQVRGLADFADVDEPDETGDTFAENARQKATYYGKHIGGWVLADDSGLQIDALDGAPGVYSARFAGCDSSDGKQRDAANNAKVLELLADVPTEKRTARFCCALCLTHGEQVQLEVEGHVDGVIAQEPAGDEGFGYDPLFYVPEMQMTAAQLPAEQKNSISHRGNALRLLIEQIDQWLRGQ